MEDTQIIELFFARDQEAIALAESVQRFEQ